MVHCCPNWIGCKMQKQHRDIVNENCEHIYSNLETETTPSPLEPRYSLESQAENGAVFVWLLLVLDWSLAQIQWPAKSAEIRARSVSSEYNYNLLWPFVTSIKKITLTLTLVNEPSASLRCWPLTPIWPALVPRIAISRTNRSDTEQ
jgi:hypothetical protein